jgi:hypothetical protein
MRRQIADTDGPPPSRKRRVPFPPAPALRPQLDRIRLDISQVIIRAGLPMEPEGRAHWYRPRACRKRPRPRNVDDVFLGFPTLGVGRTPVFRDLGALSFSLLSGVRLLTLKDFHASDRQEFFVIEYSFSFFNRVRVTHSVCEKHCYILDTRLPHGFPSTHVVRVLL